MKKFLKGLVGIIAALCIAFTAFFVYSYATGNTQGMLVIEAGIAKLANKAVPGSNASSGSASTIGVLTSTFGLTTSQAGEVVSLAEDLGIDMSDPVEVSALAAKNAGNVDEIKEIAAAVQAGQMTEAQAKAKLAGIIDV